MAKYKYCPKCKTPKILTDFNRDHSIKDKRCRVCRACFRKYRRINRVASYQRSREWSRNNPEKRAKIVKKYKSTKFAWASYTLPHCKRSTHGCSIEKKDLLELWEKQKGKCAVTGIPFVLGSGPMRPDKASLDRIDSKKGYHPNNVRIVLLFIQFAKNIWSDDVFSKWCKLVASKLK